VIKKLQYISLILFSGALLALHFASAAPLSPKIGLKPIVVPKIMSAPGEDSCLNGSYFSRIFYNTPDWDNTSAADFRLNIKEGWGTSSPFPGAIDADGRWSARFDAGFVIISLEPPAPPPPRANLFVFTTLQGYAKVLIDGVVVFDGINYGSPREFLPLSAPTLDSSLTHSIVAYYQDYDNTAATLELWSQICDAAPPYTCGPKDLFFTGNGTGPSRPDTLSFTKQVANMTALEDESPAFTIDATSVGSPLGVQWQKDIGLGFANCTDSKCSGATTKTLTYGPVTIAEDNGIKLSAQIANDVCALNNTAFGTLTVTPKCIGTCPIPLSCSQDKTTVEIGKPVNFTGGGGDPAKYIWSVSPDGVPPTCTKALDLDCDEYPAYQATWSTEGTKTITLKQDLLVPAICTVTVTKTPPSTLSCSAPKAIIGINENITFTGTGGDPMKYKWDTIPAGIPATCTDPVSCPPDPTKTPPIPGHPLFMTHWPSEGIKTVILRQALLPDAKCFVEVKKDPLGDFYCKADYANVKTKEPMPVHAYPPGRLSYTWTAQTSDALPPRTQFGSSNLFYVKHTDPGIKSVKVVSGPDTYTCTFEVKPSAALSCKAVAASVEVDKSMAVVPTPSGVYTWTALDGGTPSPYTGTSFTVTHSAIGTKRIKVESSSESAECSFDVTAKGTEPPKDQKINSLYVYDQSPIAPVDCSAIVKGKLVEQHKTTEFDNECNPHPVVDDPVVPISVGTKGLTYSSSLGRHVLTVIPRREDLTVKDANPDPNLADLSEYNTIFFNERKDIPNIVEVSQVNVYRRVIWLLREFATFIWPSGSETGDQYQPKGLPLGLRIEVDKPLNICGHGEVATAYINFDNECSLDTQAIDHEFYHFITGSLTTSNIQNSGHGEVVSLEEGISDYFAVRNGLQDTVAKYAIGTTLIGHTPGRHILAIDEPPYGADGYGAKYRFFDWVYGFENKYGAKIANILISVRNTLPDDRAKHEFDWSVLVAWKNLGASYNQLLFRSSITQQYYIELYRRLTKLVYFKLFPEEGLTYFKKLVYTKAKVGTAVGNIMPIAMHDLFQKVKCVEDAKGKYPLYHFSSPPINAVGEDLSQLHIYFRKDGIPVKSFDFKLEQPSMHIPIIGFNADIPMDFGKGPFKVSLSATTQAELPFYPEIMEEVPGELHVIVCK